MYDSEAKSLVLLKYPSAYCDVLNKVMNYAIYVPSIYPWSGQISIVGRGQTSESAWENASGYIERELLRKFES
jgi:hypothetical protein